MSRVSPSVPDHCVLIVDDDDATRRRLALALAREGLATIEASDGERALELVRSEPVALVLLDGGMPGLSGLEVIHRLRSDPERVMLPVVMVTAAVELSARVAGLEAGADDYVAKPINIPDLVARIRSQLRRQDAWRQAARSLQRSASIIEALARLPRGAAADETGNQICALLAEEFDAVAIVAFTDRRAAVVSTGGAYTRIACGHQLDRRSTYLLRERCGRGPWIGADEGLELFPSLARLACGLPLEADGHLLGAMLFGSMPASIEPDTALLSTAIGLGGIVASLLAPGLARRDSQRRHSDDRIRFLRPHTSATHFQPVMDLASGRAVGYEALTRWADGVAPDVRLAAAREAGYAGELERAMIANALTEAVRLTPGGWVSVNASSVLVIDDPNLPTLLALADRDVVLEITEQEPVSDYPALRRAVSRLGAHVRLAIDDAGAGYASLRHILALEPSFVKLDREWIREIDGDPTRQALLVGLQHFANETGRALIAEGIETAGELETVTALGIRFGQGYFLGRPAAMTPTARKTESK